MFGNPYRWRAAIPQLEYRLGTAGCLLSVLFTVPFLATYLHINTWYLALFVLFYAGLVVPLATGLMSGKAVIGTIRKVMLLVMNEAKWTYRVQQVGYIASWLHYIYLQFEGIHITTMQVVFNMAAEKLLCPAQRLCCLYVLLFYSVLAYLQRSLQTRPWTQLLSESTTAEFIKLTTAFIIVRLGKGVAMSLVLLTFTLQFNHLEPTYTYIVITLAYFLLSQYQNNSFVRSVLTRWLSNLELQWLEGMEDCWVPFFLSFSAISASVFIFVIMLFTTDCYIIMIIMGYTNIFVPASQAWEVCWRPLAEQRAAIAKFPLASWKNPQVRSGASCAVCLDTMSLLASRVTPCGHVFHGACLRRCLQYSNQCPLCKHIL